MRIMNFIAQNAGKVGVSLALGFMIAWHNVYKQETRMPADIVYLIDQDEEQEDGTPKRENTEELEFFTE